MGKLFCDGQVPPQKVLEIIVSYMHRVASPTYVGILSLETGYSLARTQEMLDLLEERGEVRPLADEEKKQRGIPQVANVYVVVGPIQLIKARF